MWFLRLLLNGGSTGRYRLYVESQVAGGRIRTTNDQTLQEAVRKGRPDQGHEAHGVL